MALRKSVQTHIGLRSLVVAAAVVLLAITTRLPGLVVDAQEKEKPKPPQWGDGTQAPLVGYTAAQAEQGKKTYMQHCASCHGQHLDDGEFAPPLRGLDFRGKWAPRVAGDLFDFIDTRMP